ncbi:MAG TPA: hypothetical protein VNF74_14835 [Terriglobales bacterium]|nr:hypothetical protein [Terriglobales bacterium]
MPTEFQQGCAVIEECYEFTLSYAAQGHAGDAGSAPEARVREHLRRAATAIAGLEASGMAAIAILGLAPAERYATFFAVLGEAARRALAAIELVLAQPAISSQLMDSLNASLHLRALLADMFLAAEVLEARAAARQAPTMASH